MQNRLAGESLPAQWMVREDDHIAKWRVAILALALAFIYLPIIRRLAAQWVSDPTWVHCLFIPIFSLYVLWRRREHLRTMPLQPSWWGLEILILGFLFLAIGVLGADLFVSRISFIIVLSGTVVWFLGWNHLRAAAFPISFLLLMIPIPALIFQRLMAPLLQLAFIGSANLLSFLGVSVLREGNSIFLPSMYLYMGEACSGLMSVLSLMTVAIIYSYLRESRGWIRVALVLSSLPIAVLAVVFRIVGTGLIAQYGGPEYAERFFHTFGNELSFAFCIGLLLLVHWSLTWIGRLCFSNEEKTNAHETAKLSQAEEIPDPSLNNRTSLRFVSALAVMLITGSVLAYRAHSPEIVPPHLAFANFPLQLGIWSGQEISIEANYREIGEPGRGLLRFYRSNSSEQITLFIDSSDERHSPERCLPEVGWKPLQLRQIPLEVPGITPFLVNEYIVAKGNDRQLVLFWFQGRNRAIASEHRDRLYIVLDRILKNRTDGALIRLSTLILPGESTDQALQRILPFANQVVPQLPHYIPE